MFEHTSRHAKGYGVWFTKDGKQVEKDSMQCVHCGKHWFVQPGSGKQRGWCMNCGGPTCGANECLVCVPFMKKIEEQERRDRLYRSVIGV